MLFQTHQFQVNVAKSGIGRTYTPNVRSMFCVETSLNTLTLLAIPIVVISVNAVPKVAVTKLLHPLKAL
jgi:hypothetical protein